MADPIPARPPIEYASLKTAEGLLDALSPRNARWKPEPALWMFRGHGGVDWKLLPLALRLCLDGELRDYDADAVTLPTTPELSALLHLELVLLQRFMVTADLSGLGVPEDRQALRSDQEMNDIIAPAVARAQGGEFSWPPTKLLSILALAQHYGVPTRLLDWTWRPRVAAFFAAETSAAERPDGRVPCPPAAVALQRACNGCPAKEDPLVFGWILGGADENRTRDLFHAMEALSQLSYSPGNGDGND